MTFLLDTCILSKLRRLSKYPDQKLQAWIEQYPAALYFISVFSVAEIQAGISKLDDEPADRSKYKSDLERWFLSDLIPDFAGRILEFDTKLSIRWGTMVGESKRKGINLPVMDSLIAATALQHELILVSENVSDFKHTNVMLVNPWDL